MLRAQVPRKAGAKLQLISQLTKFFLTFFIQIAFVACCNHDCSSSFKYGDSCSHTFL